jgi:hypothetical protein
VVVGTGGEAGHLNPETSTAGLVVRQGAFLIGAGKLIGASLPGPNQNIGSSMNVANFVYSVVTPIDFVLEPLPPSDDDFEQRWPGLLGTLLEA